jgi:hypothetical protein
MRSAVVLVRATVAEAFRDTKRGGRPKSAFAGLAAEGLDGSALVFSSSARNLVAMALERKPSGTEKSVCISYTVVGEERQAFGRMGETKKASFVCMPRRKTSSTVVLRGGGGKLGGTYILGPNIYKYHVCAALGLPEYKEQFLDY